MGRKKIPITKIDNLTSRNTTYKKRSTGLLKKATELSILCDVHVGLVMRAPWGALQHFWPNDKMDEHIAALTSALHQKNSEKPEKTKRCLKRVLESPEKPERTKRCLKRFLESPEKQERTKRCLKIMLESPEKSERTKRCLKRMLESLEKPESSKRCLQRTIEFEELVRTREELEEPISKMEGSQLEELARRKSKWDELVSILEEPVSTMEGFELEELARITLEMEELVSIRVLLEEPISKMDGSELKEPANKTPELELGEPIRSMEGFELEEPVKRTPQLEVEQPISRMGELENALEEPTSTMKEYLQARMESDPTGTGLLGQIYSAFEGLLGQIYRESEGLLTPCPQISSHADVTLPEETPCPQISFHVGGDQFSSGPEDDAFPRLDTPVPQLIATPKETAANIEEDDVASWLNSMLIFD